MKKSLGWLCGLAMAGLAVGDYVDTNAATEFGPQANTEVGESLVGAPAQVISAPAVVSPVGERLRIASYNLENFCDGQGDMPNATPESVLQQSKDAGRLIDRIDPDILMLEEIENSDALIALNQILAKPYPLGFITSFNAVEDGGEIKLNIAVLARVPLVGLCELDFSGLNLSPRPPRGFLSCQVDLGEGHRLLLYGVHLKSNFGDRRKNQLRREAALHAVRTDADALRQKEPDVAWEVLVAGDMNVDPSKQEFRNDQSLVVFNDWVDLWKDRPLAERITVPTRHGDPYLEFPPATFDRFIASPELTTPPWKAGLPQVLQEGVETNDVTTNPGFNGHVSDHHPIYLDLHRN